MTKLIIGAVTALVAFLIWQITGRLSPDALGMALGVLFGVLAGLPVALLVLAASQRQRRPDPPTQLVARRSDPYHSAPPVIILTGGTHVPNQNQPGAQHAPLLPGQRRPHHSGAALPDPDDGEDW